MRFPRFFLVLILLATVGLEFLQVTTDSFNAKVAQANQELQQEHANAVLLLTSDHKQLKHTLQTIKKDYPLQAVHSLSPDNEVLAVTFDYDQDLAFIMASYQDQITLEPDYLMQAAAMPSDALFAEQWYLQNTGQSYHSSSTTQFQGTTGIDINWTAAFEHSSLRGQGVTIAVIDSGLRIGHTELQSRLWQNTSEASDGLDNDSNGLIDDINGWNYLDNNHIFTDHLGHGTQAAGIIAANNDTVGIVGIAPTARIMPLKVLDEDGRGRTSNVIKAINYAVAKGAKVVNMSFGGAGADTVALINTCNNAVNAGVVLVASAGNANTDILQNHFAPASIPSVIAVGSITSLGDKASFSNTGNGLSLVTPGVSLLTTRSQGSEENAAQVLADGSNNYIISSGTSFSSPMVAAAVALLIEQNPALTPAQIRARLEQTARDLGTTGKDSNFGYGLLDVQNALAITAPPVTPTNQAPQIISSTWSSNPLVNDGEISTALSVVATDNEHDTLTVSADFTALGSTNQTLILGTNNTYTSAAITTSSSAGDYTIPIQVSDPTHTATGSIVLTVAEAPATITISGPTSETIFNTSESQLTLSGQLTGNIATIKVNDISIPGFSLGQTTWNSTITIAEGTTVYNVNGFNSAAQLLASDSIVITRAAAQTATPPPTSESEEEDEEESSSSRRRERRRNRDRDDPIVEAQTTITFADVPADHFAFQQISDLTLKGSIHGQDNFYFPNRVISRGEFLKVAMHDAGLVNSTCASNQAHFSDITNNVFSQEIHCAVYQRIVWDGKENFFPHQPITREQAILWLVAIRRIVPETNLSSSFPDVRDNRTMAYIETAKRLQWVQGNNGLFYPHNSLSRAEAAKVIVNSRH
ncbi:MAG: S8 family serine peptidase [Candidatus Abawacabacteria bacterium]|nr:S8 family serine peptidase [Candidatus Abawacabacteria bacterium]